MRRSIVRLGALMVMAALLGGAGGCGRQLVGVAKPAALVAWEPQPQEAGARITAVKATADYTYVGFSNGERFVKATGATDWTAFDEGPAPCNQPTPRGPVTGFAVTVGRAFAAFAGTPGASELWHSSEASPCWAQTVLEDDFRSVSVSPFSAVELLALGRTQVWVSHDFTNGWEYGGRTTSLQFDGVVNAVAAGASPTGSARAWLGDAAGHVYYSDDLARVTPGTTTSAPEDTRWQPVAPDPGFPHRPAVAISIDPGRPQTVWVTFAGLQADSLWTSDDGGSSWRNPRGGELPSAGAAALDGGDDDGGADAGAPVTATFTAVSPVPGMNAAYVAALEWDRNGNLTATSYWTAVGSDGWWRM